MWSWTCQSDKKKLFLFVSLPTTFDTYSQPHFIRHLPNYPHGIPVCSFFCTWTMWGPLGPVWGDPRTVANTTPLCGVRLFLSVSEKCSFQYLPPPPHIPVLLAKETRHDVPRPGRYPHRLVQGLEWVWTDGGTVVPPEEGVPHPGALLTHMPWTLAGRLHRNPHPRSWGQQCR